jgi:aminoacylase
LQYIDGIRQLLKLHPKYQPQPRAIYLTFVPDDEVGGAGTAAFLDSTSNSLDVFYGERLPWWIDVTATGPTGHGSMFIDNTAVERLVALTQKALQFRKG